MPYAVSSSFVDACLSRNPTVVKKFTIGSSDYSSKVVKWPTIIRKWDDIKSTTFTVALYNQDQQMNFLRNDKTHLQDIVTLGLGFTINSSDELIDLFQGKISRVEYVSGQCNITAIDKFKQLEERVIGTSDVPVSFTTSNYLPSDLAWLIATSYGGFDTTASSANIDIDYEAFQTWAAIFSGDNVLMQAEFSGAKVLEALRKLARHTRSGIFVKENKLSFVRFGSTNANVASLGNHELYDLSLYFDDDAIVNKQYVFGNYSVESDYWALSVYAANTSSINSFSLRESTEKDENVWYVTSASALNLAQRALAIDGLPYDKIECMSPLITLPQLIGDTIYIEDPFHELSESYRIMEQRIDMDKYKIKLRIDRSQLTTFFTLDVSSLDGSDTLS